MSAPPLKRSAVDGRGEGVVDYEWHAVAVGQACKPLNVEHLAARIGDGFAKHHLGVRAESLLYLVVAGFGIDEGALYAELLERHAEQVERSAVNLVGGHDVAPASQMLNTA